MGGTWPFLLHLRCNDWYDFEFIFADPHLEYQFLGNPFDIAKMLHDFLSEFIQNAYFAVDSFFFMSGLLLTFIWLVHKFYYKKKLNYRFKNYQKNPAATNSPISWVMFYIHRIIRWD